jgi:hypothetical protein
MLQNLFKNRRHSQGISIIVPTRKNIEFLQDCFCSLIKSSKIKNIEILVGIDNCLETLEYLDSGEFTVNNKIKFYYFSKQLGPYVIRNTLVQRAKYQNVLFFDSDDIMLEESIDIILEAMLESNIVKFKFYNFINGLDYRLQKNLNLSEIYAHGVFCIKKDLFLNLNGFLGWTCGADTEFYERYMALGIECTLIDIPLFLRRYHDNNISRVKDTAIDSPARRNYENIIYQKRRNNNWMLESIEIFSCQEIKIYKKSKNKKLNKTYNVIFEKDKEMAIITCHFNWCGYKNPIKNLNRFLNQMEMAGIPVYGVELSLNDDFATRNRKNWKHIIVDKHSVCFQKEACINLVEKLIPEKYQKIAWIDGDLEFTNPNWYTDTVEALNSYKLVQMYADGIKLDEHGRIESVEAGIMKAGGPPSVKVKRPGYPGGAWAARRDLWKHGGLFPYCVVGSGDIVFIYSIFDQTDGILNNVNIDYLKNFPYYFEWKKTIREYVNKSVTYIPGEFIHNWHGHKPDRNYSRRHDILENINFSEKNIMLDENGVARIEHQAQELYNNIYQYFLERKEDGILQEASSKKVIEDMAVITCFFNWGNFNTPCRNLHRFLRQAKIDQIPVYGAEISLDGNFTTAGDPNWIHISATKENICFQKEACLNLVEKIVPDKYKKLAWIDCDFVFSNKNWYRDASDKLNRYKLVQLFSYYIAGNERGEIIRESKSLMFSGGPQKHATHAGPPGCAWAAQRSMWKEADGLYPYAILGGGDSLFICTIFDMLNPDTIPAYKYSKDTTKYKKWKYSIQAYANENDVSYIDGEIIHDWHGDMKSRNYDKRYEIIKNMDFENCIEMDSSGIVKIVNVNESVYDDLLNYFKTRNEDGVIIKNE